MPRIIKDKTPEELRKYLKGRKLLDAQPATSPGATAMRPFLSGTSSNFSCDIV